MYNGLSGRLERVENSLLYKNNPSIPEKTEFSGSWRTSGLTEESMGT